MIDHCNHCNPTATPLQPISADSGQSYFWPLNHKRSSVVSSIVSSSRTVSPKPKVCKGTKLLGLQPLIHDFLTDSGQRYFTRNSCCRLKGNQKTCRTLTTATIIADSGVAVPCSGQLSPTVIVEVGE